MSKTVGADADGFRLYHRELLPKKISEGNGRLAWEDLRNFGTLAIRTPVGGYTFLPTNTETDADGNPVDGTIEIVEGDECADTIVELDLESWLGLVSDLDTAPGLFYGGRATVPLGNPMRFIRWEPGLRALFHGLPVFDPDTADLRNADGSELDPATTFSIDVILASNTADSNTDDTKIEDGAAASEARHFLNTAGYLVVKNVFTPAEVEQFVAGTRRAAAEASQDDEQSWWGRTEAGEDVLTRVLDAQRQPELAGIPRDERVLAIGAVSPDNLAPRLSDSRDSISILWKRKNVAEGLSDLPWHRDCGMGGHAINCPLMVMSICLTSGSPGAGELRVLPGSHKGSFPFVDGRDTHAPEGVAVDVEAGDLSLHYGDAMHASMPPTDDTTAERISLLIAFVPEQFGSHLGDGVYNDVLLGNEGGQIEHLADKLGHDKYRTSEA